MMPRIVEGIKKEDAKKAKRPLPVSSSTAGSTSPDESSADAKSTASEKVASATGRSRLPTDLREHEWQGFTMLQNLRYQISRDFEFAATTVDAHFLGLGER